MSDEALLAELRQKEQDLVLAAQVGKELLGENERVKKDLSTLKRELQSLEEVI